MQAQVIGAIIAAVVSLIVAVLSVVMSARNATKTDTANRQLADRQGDLDKELAMINSDLARQAKLEERADTARVELDRHREPLMQAALDLTHRLDNIRNDSFFEAYLRGDQRRREMAISSTLYRFARYLCVVENLYDNVALLRFEQDEATRPVLASLKKVGRTFASDDYGRTFMMWREEQRGVAELMRLNEPGGCIGYASFVDRLDTFHPWFESFDDGLEPDPAPGRERLRMLQWYLANLVLLLDAYGTHRDECTSLLARSKYG